MVAASAACRLGEARVGHVLRAHGANVDRPPGRGLGHEMLVHGYEEIRLNMAWLPPIGGRFVLRARPAL
jgi:hypothetical protein